MANKTIYVSEKDESLFEQAKELAGEALSSVIVRALREFVSRHQDKQKGMKEVSVKVGVSGSEREQRFVGSQLMSWKGFDDSKEWYMSATIYLTQKSNWAVYLTTVSKASLFLDKKKWKESGDYLINPRHSELIVGTDVDDLKNKIPTDLFNVIQNLAQKEEKPVEYLDI